MLCDKDPGSRLYDVGLPVRHPGGGRGPIGMFRVISRKPSLATFPNWAPASAGVVVNRGASEAPIEGASVLGFGTVSNLRHANAALTIACPMRLPLRRRTASRRRSVKA